MKFNLIISNPPYNQNVHLRILYDLKDLSSKICFIHPAKWLLSNRPYESPIKKLVNKIKNDLVLKSCDTSNGNVLFKANTGIISISYFDENYKGSIYFNKQKINDINEIDEHGVSIIYKSLKQKILLFSKNNNLESKSVNNGNFIINAHNAKAGKLTPVSWNFEMFLNKENFKNSTKQWVFETYNEKKYFYQFLKLKITRFMFSIYSTERAMIYGELASVPYMPTYEHEWTDEMVAKELGLTDEELKWAINWIPDYYPGDAEKYIKYKKIKEYDENIN